MGLDMYLEKVKKGLDPRQCTRELGEVERIGYWRKFNALHARLGDGTNCEYIQLFEDDILNLLKDLREIATLAQPYEIGEDEYRYIQYNLPDKVVDKIKEILPPRSGFCFGDTEIDNYYLSDVRESIVIFEEALKAVREDYDIYYYAWW